MPFLFGSAFIVPNATAMAPQPFARAAGTAALYMGIRTLHGPR